MIRFAYHSLWLVLVLQLSGCVPDAGAVSPSGEPGAVLAASSGSVATTGAPAPPPGGATYGRLRIHYEQAFGETGTHVTRVEPGCAADRAGIRVGDVILSVNGVAVEYSVGLPGALQGTTPGQQVAVRLLRDGSEMDVQAVLDPPGPFEYQAHIGL